VARLVAADVEASLELGTEVIVVPADELLAGSRVLIEKKLPPTWDVLIHGWFELSSEAPPAAVHREFCGEDGAFRAGPEDPEFDRLFAEMASELDGGRLARVAERIDRYVYDQALALFLCASKVLYAVNKHVKFGPYRTTFELAETEVDDGHWSQRTAKAADSAPAASKARDKSSTGFSGAGC